MKRTLILAALTLLVIGGTAVVKAQTEVRVLTYNIQRDIGGSDSNISAQPALAKVVNYLKPDIWTINELGGSNVAFNATTAQADLVTFIRDNLTIFGPDPQENVNYFIYLSTINDGYDTVAIVSRYPFNSMQTYSDAGNGFRKLRGLARASVTVPGGTAFDTFTTHLKALNSTANAEKRQTEADVDRPNIANWIATHHADAVAVTGDWNETEDSGEKTNWSGHQIGDTLPNLNEPYHPITTMRSAGLLDPSPVSIKADQDTIDSTTPSARFDYTMYANSAFRDGEVFDTKQYTSSQLAALNAASGTNFVATDSASASDHLPVLSIFRIGFAPVLVAVAREGAFLTITYEKILSASVTYTVEESTDLVSWMTVQSQDQIIAQNADTQIMKSSVPMGGANSLFLRVRANIAP
jgi:endonuclease/exonuclease/phosphatase family metal-dependent hydrolase